MSARFAAIDVGTNSVLLLVVERQPDGSLLALDERLEITRLGRGVDATRLLADDRIEATVAALQHFSAAARAHGVERLWVTATSAARDATNGARFFARAKAAAGVDVEVLSGDDEALYSFEAAVRELPGDGPRAVVDIGGGSTELVYGAGGRVDFRRSFDVGAVRLTERLLHGDPPTPAELLALRARLTETFSEVPPPPAGLTLVGVAGTVTTLCAIELGLDGYDGRLVQGRLLTRTALRALADRLAALPLAERRRVKGLPPQRADTILAGAEILDAVLARLDLDRLLVSDRGLRWGLLWRRAGA